MEKTHGRHKARYLYHPLVSQQQELLPRCRTQNKTPANASPYGPQSRMATLTRTTGFQPVSVPRASCPCAFTRAKHPRGTPILAVSVTRAFCPCFSLCHSPPTQLRRRVAASSEAWGWHYYSASLRGPSGRRGNLTQVTPSEAQRSRGVYSNNPPCAGPPPNPYLPPHYAIRYPLPAPSPPAI